MAYIGNFPAEKYTTFSKQTFTPDGSTTSFTLDFSVANENDLELFINNVRQEPGSGKAYTATGLTLTISSAPGASDEMYAIFQGKAQQTVLPGSQTVTGSMLTPDIAISTTGNITTTGDLTVDTDTLYVDSANNLVGVGTTSPSDSVGFTSAIDIQSSVGGAVYFRDSDSPSIATYIGYIGSNTTAYIWNQANGPILFGTNDTERMRILSSGNVGIGTSSPSARLHIANDQGGGDGRVLIDANVTSGYETSINVTDTGFEFTSSSDIRPIIFNTGSTPSEKMRIDGSGNIFVGTGADRTSFLSESNGNVQIENGIIFESGSGAVNNEIITYRSNSLILGTSGSERMRLNSTGLGIGTTSPLSKLDVFGPSSVTSFTGTSHLGLTVRGSSAATDYSGIDFIGNNQVNPVARIGVLTTGSGSSLSFGTSNSYASGVTNTAMTIDPSGGVSMNVGATISGNLFMSGSGLIRTTDGTAALPGIRIGVDNDNGLYRPSTNTIGFTTGGVQRMRITTSGVVITGSLSKSSGSFKIPHPLPEKTDTHDLVHSFIEAPQADNIYRGKVDLVNGIAIVNIDTVAGMSEGTFVLLNREVQCFTSNETGWTAVKGSVLGNILTITAQDETCTDTISWLVIGERQDQHMYDTEWTDENGKVIVEPLKPVEEELTLEDE